jgi:hypothetical protein
MELNKNTGTTETEKILAGFCDKTFSNIWSFVNPYNSNKNEFCDVITIFENHMFIFFDRNKILEYSSESDFEIKWNRWVKDAIVSQINTCNGAERYIKNGGKLYLDNKAEIELPLKYDLDKLSIHKIIVAHGAKDACLKFSSDNITGSLGVHYSDLNIGNILPFFISLSNKDPVHIFDSSSLSIILNELDTFRDFSNYIIEKERAIKKYLFITYCGEEDLLAHFLMNFDQKNNKHFIGQVDCNGFVLDQGIWSNFTQSPAYKVQKESNRISYFWDELIKEIGVNALKGKLTGDGNVFAGSSGIYEMAKEPRFIRRMLSEKMIEAIQIFPENNEPVGRFLRLLSSFCPEVKYVFLQYKIDFGDKNISLQEINKMRQYFLEIACAATKLKFPELKKVIGIGMAPLKLYPRTTKDILLLDCTNWTDEMVEYYTEENKFELNGFYLQANIEYEEFHVKEFPESRLR